MLDSSTMNRRNFTISCLTILGALLSTLTQWLIGFSTVFGSDSWPGVICRSYHTQTLVWLTGCGLALAVLAMLWLDQRRDHSRIALCLALGLIAAGMANLATAWLCLFAIDSHQDRSIPVRTWILAASGPILWFIAGALTLKKQQQQAREEDQAIVVVVPTAEEEGFVEGHPFILHEIEDAGETNTSQTM